MSRDRIETIHLLNQDIYGEHDAIVHYLTQAWTVSHQYGPQIQQIARDEMRHLKWLAHTVVALGGTPDLSIPAMRPTTSIREAMEQDMEAEIQAIEQYHDHLEKIPDPRIQRLIERVVVDEKDHYRQFGELLDRQQGEVWGAERLDQDVGSVAHQLRTLVATEYQAVLGYLMEYFIRQHQRQVGMDDEDRAIDEMKHLGWVAEQLAGLGMVPPLGTSGVTGGSPQVLDENREHSRYLAVRGWAQDGHPELLPLLDRIMSHEHYQRSVVGHDGGWTVGSLRDELWGAGGGI